MTDDSLKMYRIPELVEILGVTSRTILDYFEKGKLKGRKVGGRWVVSHDNLRAFINGE